MGNRSQQLRREKEGGGSQEGAASTASADIIHTVVKYLYILLMIKNPIEFRKFNTLQWLII